MEKKAGERAEITVKVKPNSGKFSASLAGEELNVSLKSEPEGNRANAELVQNLSHLLSCPVHILSGHRKRRKRLAVGCGMEEIRNKIQTLKK